MISIRSLLFALALALALALPLAFVSCTTPPPKHTTMTTEAAAPAAPAAAPGTGTKPIVQTGSKVLRDRAKEVDPTQITTPEMRELTKVMIETMRAAPGVGLAAPQIGLGIRVIVLEDRAELQKNLTPEEIRERERVVFPTRVIFNPVLTKIGEDQATFFEGCLSVKGYVALVDRHLEVEVTGLDENAQSLRWKVRGWPARILQHEVDHLDGTLYIDRMKSRSFSTMEQAKALYSGKSIADIKRLLDLP